MKKIERFEDLTVWQRARILTRGVYSASSKGRFVLDRGLSRQMQQAAVSVMSNIAEGFERFRRAEFHQFLSIAKGSCAELRSQLYVARDLGYIDDACFESLMSEANDVARLIGALRASVEMRPRDETRSALSTQHSAPTRGQRD